MGRFVRIDPATGAQTIISLDGIPEYNPQTAPPDPNQLSGTEVDSFTWIQNSTNSYELYYAAQDQGFSNPNYNSRFPASRLYRVNPTSGVTALANTPYQVVGEIATSNSDSTIQYTKGMAFLNGTLYGVSSGGKFYTISLGNGRASIIRDFAANPGYQFTGLTVGPQNLAGGLPGQPPVAGFFADKLFATTTSGLLVCLSTSGELLPVFAGGSTSANLGVGGIQGITFSPLDFNLWHPTMQRSADPGHGINPSFDNTRNRPQDYDLTIAGRDSTQASGGASFYFGMENWVADPAANHYLTYGPNAQYGILNSNYHEYLTSNPGLSGIGNNYNLPGGAYGSLITNSFSLATYDYGNKPTLYFNYFLDTEDANSLTVMRDSARVFVTTNDGTTWQELATNNSIRSVPGSPAELPTYPTASALENSNAPNQQVQELFDTSVTGATPGWRQARVDLGNYAGLPNLKLRFDFSTAGAALRDNATQGIPGDVTGVGATDARRARDNSHVGFYIDDILIGLAGRGEVSTASVAGQNTTYQPNPGINADPNVPKQILTGPYQLEVRRGEEFGANVVPSDSPVLIYQQFDITERMANGWSILAAPGASLSDGATFTITDGVDTVTFEFSTDNTVAQGNVRVGFANGDSRLIVARSIRDAINGAAQNGMFKVTAKLGDDTPSGNGGTNFRVDLYSATDVTTAGGALTLTAVMQSTTVSENGGTTNVVVTRQGDTSLPLQVTLTAIDPSNGSPATFARFSNGQSTIVVTIPANASSASFPITGVDDSLAQGARTIVVRPAAVGFTGIATVLDVLDDDVPALTIQFIGGSTVNEGGTRSATVTRNTPTGQALVVNLASLNSGEISVPATVTIAAGQTTSPQFTITGLQDGTADGNQVATVAAHATGLNAGLGNITVVDNGIQFPVASPTANVNVTATGGNQSNGTIAADPTTSGINQRLFMASHIDTLTPGGVPNRFVGGLQVGYSNDAGQTWTLRVIADGTDATIPTAIGYPAVASDGFGNLFLAYLNLVLDANNEPVASNRVVVLKSSDFGQTFTLMQTFTAQNLTAGVGAPAIAAAKLSNTTGSVWVSYYDNNLGKLLVIGAPVTGLGAAGAFGGPQTVGGSDNAGLPALFPAAGTQVPNIAPDLSIAPGPTGQVMVGFQTQTTFSGQGASTIFVSVDPDGLGTGASFPLNSTSVTTTNVGARDLLPAQNGTGHGINAAVGLAYDRSGGPRNGRVYMVYTSEAVQEQNNTNILLRFSDNNGATGSWSAPIQINSDTTLNSQFLPRISVDQTTGDVAIVWYDARNDVVGGSGDTDGTVNNEVQLWGAIASYPVGIAGNAPTIGPNVKISAGTSKSSTANNTYPPGIPTPPTGFGNIDFGDDIGVAFHQGVFYAMWADNSTALGNNPTLPKLDIATAAVIQTPTPPVPLPVAVVGTNQNISLRSGSQSTVDVVSKVGDSNILFAASNNRTGGVGDPRSGLFVTYSTNGGLAWNGRVIANGSDGLPAVDPLTAPNPVVATDNQGNLFLAYRTATSVVVLVSTDFGQTFSATPIATFGAGTNFDTRFSLTAGSGGVWIALADLTNNQIVTSQATVTGLGAANIGVFSAVAAITGSANGRNPVIALGPTGQAFVSFQVNGAT
ncbi:MAG: beta strand repeat-containing protein, partial [Planctomycetales bacterium]